MDLQTQINQAVAALQRGAFAEAEQLCLQALKADAKHFAALYVLAGARFNLGRSGEAIATLQAALQQNPHSREALTNLAGMLIAAGRGAEALPVYDRVLALAPGSPEILCNRGNVLSGLGRWYEALQSYDAALAAKPGLFEALVSRSNALQNMKRLPEALADSERALAIRPQDAGALNNRGVVLAALHRHAEAIACYDASLAARPGAVSTLSNRGSALLGLNRFEDALADCARALALSPQHAEALCNRGAALMGLKKHDEALASLEAALRADPHLVEALSNRGSALRALGRTAEALASYDRALALSPGNAELHNSRGITLSELGRFAEALDSHERALAADPAHRTALGGAVNAALDACDWARGATLAQAVQDGLAQDRIVVPPLILLTMADDPALHLAGARAHVRDQLPETFAPLCGGAPYSHDRTRIAYLSPDFRQHPLTSIVSELLERHDRARFEIFAISYGRDDASPARARVMQAVDRFMDIQHISDADAAQALRALEVDILVDLTGHARDARLGILARRPAPVQVNCIGYPGSMAADFMDYIIADPVVTPPEAAPFYSERIVRLPDYYSTNDSRRPVGVTPSRADCGLPEKGFVFCCFNGARKITAPVFDIWMRLLLAVPGSVLWLLASNPAAAANLRAAAIARGVEASRLVFAPQTPPPDHLARYPLADLFLDTLPYNAHTTACDALWMGLPVLTCRGAAFAGRVAASQLQAVGLPELVTEDFAAYEKLALALAGDPARLRRLRETLAANRESCALFDADRYRRHIEAAYLTMRDIARRGERPRAFDVEVLPG